MGVVVRGEVAERHGTIGGLECGMTIMLKFVKVYF